MHLTKSEALAAIASGHTLVGSAHSIYPGEVVEYRPRGNEANSHPDFYAWHVVGRPDHARLRVSQLDIR